MIDKGDVLAASDIAAVFSLNSIRAGPMLRLFALRLEKDLFDGCERRRAGRPEIRIAGFKYIVQIFVRVMALVRSGDEGARTAGELTQWVRVRVMAEVSLQDQVGAGDGPRSGTAVLDVRDTDLIWHRRVPVIEAAVHRLEDG